MSNNKYNLIVIFVVALLICGSSFAADKSVMEADIRPGHVIILVNSGYSPDLHSLLPDIPITDFKSYSDWRVESLSGLTGLKGRPSKATGTSLLDDIFIISFPDTVDVRRVMSRIMGNPDVIYVEPDYKLDLFSWPNDSLFPQQWYLHNTGQDYYAIDRLPGDSNDVLYLNHGTPGEDVNMAPIYDNPPADTAPVLLAIIDTGIDYVHPDLADKVYVNMGEIPDNGVDDDHNGLIDDYRGWDFSGDTIDVFNILGDNDATDSIGHGTHVSGLVAAELNSIGIAGYPGHIRLLPVKIFPNGYQSVSIAAIIYAADMGARIMNLSWGFPYDSPILQKALQYAVERGALPVAAAGNFGTSNLTYPASFPETFTVGGTNSDGFMTYFSTYGPFIDIVAPARDILSLRAAGTDLYAPGEPDVRIIADKYYLADGTSMAAPLVVGAAAMLMSFNPGLDAEAVKNVLRQSAKDLVDPWDDGMDLPGYDTISGWGRLDVGAAFAMAQAPSIYMTAPRDNAILSGNVAVTAAITGGYNGPVDLYYGEGISPDNWILLHHVDAIDGGDTVYVWDSDALNGHFTFRLESSYGVDEVSFRLVNQGRAEIASPIEDETVKYLVQINGSSYGPDYDSTVLSYRPEDSLNYNRLMTSTKLFFDDLIFEWPIFTLVEGYHYLRIQTYLGAQVLVDSVRIQTLSAMRAGFPVSMGGYAAISPGVADIDGDGAKEIVIGCAQGLYAYKADGTLMDNFPVMTDRDMRSMPAFDDVDGDGLLDIVAIGANTVACFNYRGQALPGWPRVAATGMTFSSYPVPMLTELYDSADSVLIYMNKYGEVYAFKYSGDPYFYSLGGLFTSLDPNINDTSVFTGLTLPFITAADLDGGAGTEVVSLYSTSIPSSGIYIWNGRNGLPPYGWDSPLALRIRQSYGGMLADVDDDGSLEIVLSGMDTTETISIWVTKDGRENLPGWPIRMPELEGWLGTAPVCVDIDGDGSKEVVVAYFNYDVGRIYAFNSDGTPYVENPALPNGLLLTTSTTLSNVVVADIDGNGIPNLLSRGGYIFPGTGYERIFAWEPNGDPTPGFPIATPTSINEVISTPFTPIIDDLDNDGTVELIMSGDNKNVFVWDLDVPYDSAMMVWPKFLHDSKNTGINPDRATPTDASDFAPVVPEAFEITGNYPNPFNPSTTIEYSLDRTADVQLEIFNILGQKVKTLVSGLQAAGIHRIVWDGTDGAGDEVASGVYFARMLGEDKKSTRKMMLLR